MPPIFLLTTLQEFILRHGNLANDSRLEVLELLKDAENQIIPLKTRRGRGHQMVPFFKWTSDRQRRRGSPMNTLMWLCFPYFSLEALRSVDLPDGSLDHPAMTLMQLYDSGSKKRQDTLSLHVSSNASNCLYVSQLWCLVVNQSESMHCAGVGFCLRFRLQLRLLIYRSFVHMLPIGRV
jgi:hypothetical protein